MKNINLPHTLIILAIVGASLGSLTLALSVWAITAKNEKIFDSPMLLSKQPSLNQSEILTAHNKYRQSVGVPLLKWSNSLAQSAQQWANHLADTNSFKHSGGDNYGENIWMGTSGYYSQTQMVDSWGAEQKYFIPHQIFPNTCQGGWQKCGHYTQIIWKKTTTVGCGLASNAGNDYFVCQYAPPGNYQGQVPF